MKDLRIGKRNGESSGDAALGFVDDDDYDGAPCSRQDTKRASCLLEASNKGS